MKPLCLLITLITLSGTALLQAAPAPANNLKTLPDFQVEKIHNVDKKTEGSWVSMCFDDQGNLYVCDQYGALFRITLKNGQIATKKPVTTAMHTP